MKIKNIKGITLISLVITIILLLILATVSIATLTGNNGILTKVKEAKKRAEIEEIKELLELQKVSYMTENYEKDLTLDSYIEYLQNTNVIEIDKIQNIDIEGTSSKLVTINGNIFILSQNGDNIGIHYQNELKRETITVPPMTADDGQRVSASSRHSSPHNAFDGNTDTVWYTSPGDNNCFLMYNFQDGPYKCNTIQITLGKDGPGEYEFRYVFQGSKDGNNWDDITDILTYTSPGTITVPSKSEENYSYFRFKSLDGAVLHVAGIHAIFISELQFYCEGDYIYQY